MEGRRRKRREAHEVADVEDGGGLEGGQVLQRCERIFCLPQVSHQPQPAAPQNCEAFPLNISCS